MSKTIRSRATLAFQTVALLFCFFALFSGRHPPAYAQFPTITSAADQKRNDDILAVQKDADKNAASIAKQWDALNGMKETLKQMQIDAAAGTSTNNKVAVGEIVALLTSIGFQVKGSGKRRRRKREEEEEEEDD